LVQDARWQQADVRPQGGVQLQDDVLPQGDVWAQGAPHVLGELDAGAERALGEGGAQRGAP